MQKAILHESGEVTPLKGVTLGQVAYFIQMYPKVHAFVIDEKVFESEHIFEDQGMDAFFGDDPVYGGY